MARALGTVLVVFLILVFGLPLVIGGVLALALAPGMMHGWWGFSPWWGIGGMLFGLALLLALGVLALWAVREMASTKGEGSRAMEILKERYARGEITREQYEQMRRDLEGR